MSNSDNDGWVAGIVIVLVCMLATGSAVWVFSAVHNYGGEGEPCYPNQTCYEDSLQCKSNLCVER